MTVVSPELALVDPCLRSDAIAALPPLQPFDFLRFERVAPAHQALDEFWFLAEEEQEPESWRPPLVLAASVYAATALARVVVMDGLFVLALAAAVVVLNAIG